MSCFCCFPIGSGQSTDAIVRKKAPNDVPRRTALLMTVLPQALVFFHQGLPSYLMCSLWQAHLVSPKIKIILIGDIDPKLTFVTWIDLRRYTESWREMKEVYIHLSTNVEKFERFCFYRWFAIEALMREMKLEPIIHLDSDLMMYFDPLKETIDIGDSEIAIGSTGSHSPHFLYISSGRSLKKICDMMISMFTEEAKKQDLISHFEKQKSSGGGVCDMYVFGYFSWNRIIEIYELNKIRDGKIFDQSLGDDRICGKVPCWQMESGRKKLFWRNGVPFVTSLDGLPVRTMTLHFQGPNKKFMKANMSRKPFAFLVACGRLEAMEWFSEKVRKIRFFGRHFWRSVTKRMQGITGLFNFVF